MATRPLVDAAIALDGAAAVLSSRCAIAVAAQPTLGRPIRSPTTAEVHQLAASRTRRSSVSSSAESPIDPSRLTMDQLLALLEGDDDRRDCGEQLRRRWNAVNAKVQALMDISHDPDEQFIEESVASDIEEMVNKKESEIESLKAQIAFLDESLAGAAPDDDVADGGRSSELELGRLMDQLHVLHDEIDNGERRPPPSPSSIDELNGVVNDLVRKIEEAERRASERRSSSSSSSMPAAVSQELHRRRDELRARADAQMSSALLPSIRNSSQALVERRARNGDAIALGLALLQQHGGCMPLDQFKAQLADPAQVYALVGLQLIDIDRSKEEAIVTSSLCTSTT